MPLQPSPESKGQDTAKSSWALRDKESKLNKMIAKKKKIKSKLKFKFAHRSQLMISATKHHMVLCEAINMLLFQTHFYWHFPSVNRCSWLPCASELKKLERVPLCTYRKQRQLVSGSVPFASENISCIPTECAGQQSKPALQWAPVAASFLHVFS